MESTQRWNYSPSEPIFNPAASANVSSYFMRPVKVVKSNSRNTSPRMIGRRRTTTSTPTVSSRTRSVVDHLRSNLQPRRDSDGGHSRPLSWHPDSVEASNMAFNYTAPGQGLSPWNFSTTQIHGLVTPTSYPAMDEPQIQELFTPLDELPSQDYNLAYASQSYNEQPQTWPGQGHTKDDSYSFPMFFQQPSVQPSWQHNQPTSVPSVPTAPPSPDVFTMHNVGLDHLSLNSKASDPKQDSEELVGMGLYDSPAEVQSSSVLFGNSSSSGRKGLKLEESFVPEERDDDDDDEEEGGEDEDGDLEEETDDEAQDSVGPDQSGQIFDFSVMDDNDQSITSHLTYGMQPQVDSIASKYLATLRQLNSAYYPAGHSGYGWI